MKEEKNDHIKQETDPEKAINAKYPKVRKSQTSEVPSQVATKNDNTPVEVTDWDIWTVHSYQHPKFLTVRAKEKGTTSLKIKNPSKVLICKPGTYSPETHGRLFDTM